MAKDIFTQIAERDANEALKPKPRAKCPAWVVSLGNGRISRRMSYPRAKRLAARFNRLFKTDIAYAVR